MNRGNKFYLVFLILFSVASLIIILVKSIKPVFVDYPTVWYTQGFLLAVMLISHFLASKGLKDKAVDFHIYYMGSMGIRFLLAVFYLFFVVYFCPEKAWVVVINFFLLYFLYTSFEIYSLMSNLRAEN